MSILTSNPCTVPVTMVLLPRAPIRDVAAEAGGATRKAEWLPEAWCGHSVAL